MLQMKLRRPFLLLPLFLSFIRFFIALRVHKSYIAFIFHHLRIIIDNERKTNCGCSRLIATEYHISHKTQANQRFNTMGRFAGSDQNLLANLLGLWNRLIWTVMLRGWVYYLFFLSYVSYFGELLISSIRHK